MNFNDLVGQNRVVESLKNAIENDKVSHAYIFEGPKGIGRKTVASIFAKALVCKADKLRPCGNCVSCLKSDHENHPDIKRIVELEKASLGIDLIRELQKDLYIKPYEADKKIYIIPEADTMTDQAQNGLLKILEEPPRYAVIILIVENSLNLLSTVLSRSVLIKFKLNSITEVRDYLQKAYPEIEHEAPALSAFSGGIIGKAINMVSSTEFRGMRKEVLRIFVALLNNDETASFDNIAFFSENKSDADNIIEVLVSLARDVLIIKELGDSKLLINKDMKNELEAFANKVPSGVMDRVVDIISDTKNKIDRNVNYSLAIEMMLMKSREEIYGKRSWSTF